MSGPVELIGLIWDDLANPLRYKYVEKRRDAHIWKEDGVTRWRYQNLHAKHFWRQDQLAESFVFGDVAGFAWK